MHIVYQASFSFTLYHLPIIMSLCAARTLSVCGVLEPLSTTSFLYLSICRSGCFFYLLTDISPKAAGCQLVPMYLACMPRQSASPVWRRLRLPAITSRASPTTSTLCDCALAQIAWSHTVGLQACHYPRHLRRCHSRETSGDRLLHDSLCISIVPDVETVQSVTSL